MAAVTAALLAGTVISAGVSAYSQYSQGQTQQAIAKRNAEASRNAALTNWEEAKESGRRQRINNEAVSGSMRARLAGQGGVISTGSDLNIMGETAERLKIKELDAYRAASLDQMSLFGKANELEWEGENAATASKIGAGTTLLAGRINAAKSAYDSYKSGSLLQI